MIGGRFVILKSNHLNLKRFALLPVIYTCKSFSTSRHRLGAASESDQNRNVIKSSFKEVASVKGLLVQELIRSESSKWETQEAYECAVTGLKYTHNDVHKLGRSFGAALLQTGLKRGDIAAILLPNCPQYSVIFSGMLETGIIPSPMNPLHTPAEIGAMLVQSNAKCIVTIPLLSPLIQGVKNSLKSSSIKLMVSVPFGGGETPEGFHNYNDMIKTDATTTKFLQGGTAHGVNTSSDTALVLWSSGTSGLPKGVMLTHENICVQLLQVLQDGVTKYKKGGETYLGLAPMFHAIGCIGFLALSLTAGAKVVTVPRFDPALFTKTLKTHKLTAMHVVPPLVGFLVANPALVKEDLGAIHTVACGGAPTGAHIINALHSKFGDQIRFQEAFGMTELTGIAHINPIETCNSSLGSVGKVMPGARSKIVDLVTGEALGPGRRGEICFQGDQVMKGYLNNEEATRNTIDSEGWLHTGDIGTYDDQGYFNIVDRLKELIKVKGFQVSPSELEEVLRKHPKIAEIGIIGIPDERSGEVPRAYIVPKDADLAEKDIHRFLEDKVAMYKQLSGGVEFVKELPKSPSGKLLRRILLTNYVQSQSSKIL